MIKTEHVRSPKAANKRMQQTDYSSPSATINNQGQSSFKNSKLPLLPSLVSSTETYHNDDSNIMSV